MTYVVDDDANDLSTHLSELHHCFPPRPTVTTILPPTHVISHNLTWINCCSVPKRIVVGIIRNGGPSFPTSDVLVPVEHHRCAHLIAVQKYFRGTSFGRVDSPPHSSPQNRAIYSADFLPNPDLPPIGVAIVHIPSLDNLLLIPDPPSHHDLVIHRLLRSNSTSVANAVLFFTRNKIVTFSIFTNNDK
jgi:hypothetical protein